MIRVSIVNDDGKEMGFSFSLKNVKSDDVWLDVKKAVENKINEDNQ